MIYGNREVLIKFKEPENIFVKSAQKKKWLYKCSSHL